MATALPSRMTGRTPADQEMNEYSRRAFIQSQGSDRSIPTRPPLRFPALIVDERGGDETEETAVRPAGLSR
jgi:hypothetical protein